MPDSLKSLQPEYKIFYNMYLEVELSTLFESAGAVFTPELLNSVHKQSDYLTSSQQAVNLGIYAVDLSYARVFGQVQTAGKYFSAMRKLAEAMGIPTDYFESTVKRFENNISNKDSLIYLANEVYQTTDEYLKENRRHTTAAMIIMGGWIEAIHIALDVAEESRDVNIIERLVYQKGSLEHLMSMLKGYGENDKVAEYLAKLEEIKKVFDAVDITFDGSVELDDKFIDNALAQLIPFKQVVNSFRNELTD
jgi:hypothetical protein